MKTARSLSPRFRAAGALAAGAAALLTALGTPCHAQFPGQPPPSPNQPPSSGLPNGVDQLYAMQGTNDLLAMATPEGYERIRELVKNIDGQTDIIRTKVVTVDTNRSDLEKLGYTIVGWPKPDGEAAKTASSTGGALPDGVERVYALQGGGLVVEPTSAGLKRVALNLGTSPLSSNNTATLIAALESGKLPAIETLRITTRENTVVDTLLRNANTRVTGSGTPFSLVPHEDRNGQVILEVMEPTSIEFGVQSGQTAILVLPGLTTDAVRLLFLTPTVLPSSARPIR
jgi:hypothetical protein